jgi:hypothetical protein
MCLKVVGGSVVVVSGDPRILVAMFSVIGPCFLYSSIRCSSISIPISRYPNRFIQLSKAPSLDSSNPTTFSIRTSNFLVDIVFGPRLSAPTGLACERKTSRVSRPPGMCATVSRNNRIRTLMICSIVGISRSWRITFIVICANLQSQLVTLTSHRAHLW